MNLHVFNSPTTKGHYSLGNSYKVPYKLADEYHIYGFYWGKDFLRYYIDGTLVRSVKNTHWHSPMTMYFDSETMVDWLGEPQEQNLPSTYSIDYIRSWKNSDTIGDWTRKYTFHNDRGPNKYVKKWVVK